MNTPNIITVQMIRAEALEILENLIHRRNSINSAISEIQAKLGLTRSVKKEAEQYESRGLTQAVREVIGSEWLSVQDIQQKLKELDPPVIYKRTSYISGRCQQLVRQGYLDKEVDTQRRKAQYRIKQ